MRLARLLTPIALLAISLIAGCGSSDGDEGTTTGTESAPGATVPAGASAKSCAVSAAAIGQLRVTGVDCDTGSAVVAKWDRTPGCISPPTAARFSCSIHGYRCLGTVAELGIAVSCARPQRSISFIAKRR